MIEEQNSRAQGVDARGLARVDGRIRNLASRIEPGEIAVVDQIDLDRASAHALASRSPKAVLNASPSTSGRHRVLGPRILLDAGIIVIDDLGQDVMAVREGETLEIRGSEVLRDGAVIASGHLLDAADLERDEREQRRMISTQIGSFAASIDEYLDRDGGVLRGEGVPVYPKALEGKTVLLVLDDDRADADLKSLRRWIGDAAPVVIAVDAGADTARRARIAPDFVVGDMERMDEKALRGAKRRIVVRGHDGIAPGKERLDRMGLHCDALEMSGTAEDAAILVATHSGASSIVVAGGSHDLDDFIDRGRSAMAPSFFTRLAAGDALVSAKAVAASHRPRISGGWLALLLLVVLACLGAALWSTPWGRDLFTGLAAWAHGLVTASPGAHPLTGPLTALA
ncbi:putative cytokinetic ring protein SteA [Actinomyces culturomici]|uniref:putative cytokinetic ring protein SteA n=1 Tax=Actinomyces culturomici TaxID=1926276 RepID=UPI001F2F3B21|nr:putative cytokinetic ring protein SteA [Actinomyces culturomici]